MSKIVCIIFMSCILTSCGEKFHQEFVSSDVDNFWNAYDKITSTQDTVSQLKYLDSIYIKNATPGLNALMEVRDYTPKKYLNAIREYPKFWNSLRANTTDIDQHYEEIQNDIRQLKKLYPELKPSPIYFSMGVFRTNGTIRDGQVLIGSEMALSSKKVEISELPEYLQEFNTLYNPIEDLPFLCTHEYVHTQQNLPVDNLLSYCIYEGIPEFIATLATEKKSYVEAIDFGSSNYEKVRNKFEEDLYIASRTYNWLWSTQEIFGHRDMGYSVGFEMAKGYYENAENKDLAIKEMIQLDYTNERQIEQYVDQSKYLTKSLTELFSDFENSRPTVIEIEGIEDGGKNVQAGQQTITVHFSEPLNGYNTGIDFGELGQEAMPKIDFEKVWASDNKSWSFVAKLESDKHYQILISNNFRLENGIPLKPHLIEFWTTK